MSRKLRTTLDKIKPIKQYTPYWLKNVLSSLIILGILIIISKILSTNINVLLTASKQYDTNISAAIDLLSQYVNGDIYTTLKNQVGNINIAKILSLIVNSITGLFGNMIMIIVYLLFIFLEEAHFYNKLKLAISGNDNQAKIAKLLQRIESSIGNYLGLKTLVSFCTGILSYFVLMIIGIDAPFFWAFLIMLLNFIPTIGSLIATLFPATYALLQFGSIQPFLLILLTVGLIQVFIGNVVEPKLMGNTLNISSLATLLALSIWGSIWGITGMFLSVPITVIMIIIFSQFKSTKAVAILLSEKGAVD